MQTLISRFDPWHSKLCTCPPKLTFNPYTGCDHKCIYCYASSYIPKFFNCRPKKDLISKLKKESAKLKGEIISIANSSDPYPNLEAETSLTRKCLEILSQHDCKIQIITKSNIVIRDIDLLKKIPSMVSLTIITDDDNIARILEPQAPPPSERFKAAETLIEKGIPTSVRIDPIIPFVNDKPEKLIKKLASIGIKHVTSSTYKVKFDNWQRFSLKLPQTAEKIKPLYFKEGEKIGRYTYLPKEIRFKLMKTVALLVKKYGIKFGTCREGLSYLNTAPCDGSWLLKNKRKQTP
ncbi:MAG: radical SAM protein [Candidatus Bathyarchaeia archaeon]